MKPKYVGSLLLTIMLSAYLSSCTVAATVATKELIARTTKIIDSKLNDTGERDRKGKIKEDKRKRSKRNKLVKKT